MAARKMFACRLSNQALADLDRLVALLSAKTIAGRVSQSDAIAWAVSRALGELDEAAQQAARQADAAAARAVPSGETVTVRVEHVPYEPKFIKARIITAPTDTA